jgi:hypothetical protein
VVTVVYVAICLFTVTWRSVLVVWGVVLVDRKDVHTCCTR